MSLNSVIAALNPHTYLRLGDGTPASPSIVAANAGTWGVAGEYKPNTDFPNSTWRWTGGIQGIPGVAGDSDRCCRFNGVSGYIDIGTMGNFGSSMGSGFTFVCAVKHNYGASRNVLCGGGDANARGRMEVCFDTADNSTASQGRIFVAMSDHSGTPKVLAGAVTTDTGISDGKWHMLAVTADPATNTITVSLDGAAKIVTYITQGTPSVFQNFATSVGVGCRIAWNGVQAFYRGFLDEVVVTPSVLSAADLTAIYNAWAATRYTLAANANWSAIKASLGDYYTITPSGNYALTFDEDPEYDGLVFDAYGTSAYLTFTSGTRTLTDWCLYAGSTVGFTVAASKTITGPIWAVGQGANYGINLNGGTLGTVYAIGAGNVGVYVASGGVITLGTGWGSDSSGTVYGIVVASTAGQQGTLTLYGGGTSSAYGGSIAAATTEVIAIGSNATTAYGANLTGAITIGTLHAYPGTNYPGANLSGGVNITTIDTYGHPTAAWYGTYAGSCVVRGGTSVGGGVTGAHGMIVGGGCVRDVTCSGLTAGAYGLVGTAGMARLDVRQLSGYAVQRGNACFDLVLYGGTDTSAITGTAGTLQFVPTAAQVQLGVAVLAETGTYNNMPDPDFVMESAGGNLNPAQVLNIGSGAAAGGIYYPVATSNVYDGVVYGPQESLYGSAKTAAQQLADDQLEVSNKADGIDSTYTILGVPGALDVAAIFNNGKAVQAEEDRLEVVTALAYIVRPEDSGPANLLDAGPGTLDLTAYADAAREEQRTTDRADVFANANFIVKGHTLLGAIDGNLDTADVLSVRTGAAAGGTAVEGDPVAVTTLDADTESVEIASAEDSIEADVDIEKLEVDVASVTTGGDSVEVE